MQDKYLIFLDIDGTLAKHEKVIEKNISEIQRVRSKGHLVFINTGRSYANLLEHIKKADYLDGFVLGIGSQIIIGGKTVFSNPMTPDVVNKVINAFWGSEHYLFFEGETAMIQVGESKDFSFPVKITQKDGYKGELLKEKISKLTVMSHGEYTKHQLDVLNELRLINMNYYMEATMNENSKGTGLKRVAEFYNIPIERTIAMGDSRNDIEMLKSAGIAVVMGDGHIEAKKHADFVSLPCIDGGVAHALKELIK